jgi:hypothetical protein
MADMQDFMISRVRAKLYTHFFCHPIELIYVRELSREVKEEINAVRRELDRMSTAGLLLSEQRGNRLYYYLNQKYPYFSELRSIVAKSSGLGYAIRKQARKLGSVDFVMFSGSFVAHIPPTQGQVEVLVIGDVVMAELSQLVKKEEERIGREINYAVFGRDEFEFRKTRRDPFMMDVLYESRVLVIGADTDFSARKAPGL